MARPSSTSSIKLPLQVWDIATRLFHWLLVLVMFVSYFSVTFADGAYAGPLMKLHMISGESALGLLLFRLIWGVIGSDTARFGNFLHSPKAALHHLRSFRQRAPDLQVGHNAAGGWMVVIMLVLLASQIGSGLFSNDDGSSEGPLAHMVSKGTSDTLSLVHSLNFNLLLAAVVVHVLVIALYARIKGQNLVLPMLTGKKRLPAATPAPHIAHPLLAVLSVLIAAGLTWMITRL